VTTGVLVMAYGTASGPDDIERYYTDIRGGRTPSTQHLAELRSRYEAIGNRFPLLEITRKQADRTAALLSSRRADVGFVPYLGMKHSPPSIEDAVASMRSEGIESAVAIVMAPHWSGMSVETYIERVEQAVEDVGGPKMTYIRSFDEHPLFIALLANRVRDALDQLPADARGEAAVIFSAHSLPTRKLEDGTQMCLRCNGCEVVCAYDRGLRGTADRVASVVGLDPDRARTAWQSAGRTDDPWWGPAIDNVIREIARQGRPGVVVCSAGFVSDHLEILYDLDIEAAGMAERSGIAFGRTRMPNADDDFIELLAAVIEEHLP
jgi:ferrochelatase